MSERPVHHMFCNYSTGEVGVRGCICVPGRGNQSWPELVAFQAKNAALMMGEQRHIQERLKELKSVRKRLDRLEKKFAEYRQELSDRRANALRREETFIRRIEELERRLRDKESAV